jgi:hypothetical protein
MINKINTKDFYNFITQHYPSFVYTFFKQKNTLQTVIDIFNSQQILEQTLNTPTKNIPLLSNYNKHTHIHKDNYLLIPINIDTYK